MVKRTFFRAIPLSALFLLLAFTGCVEQSSNIVTFDETLISTTFDNKLLAPVAIYRDNVVLDTLPARTSRTYPINRKGPVKHAWMLIAPYDQLGNKAGIEPRTDLGVQYRLSSTYTLDNGSAKDASGTSRTIFTPLVANYGFQDLRLIVNYQTNDQVITNYLIPRDASVQLTHAPYFYWNSESNVRLEEVAGFNYYMFTRRDTLPGRSLELNSDYQYEGSGRTKALVVQ
ncbi:MAG: hypothetical protein JWQ98_849 [Chlorobi bacterium]|nr:hypothetical protein [Chlorobiota bacterium]